MNYQDQATGFLNKTQSSMLGADCARQTHVERELSELERLASRIETAMDCLANKLSPVLSCSNDKELRKDVHSEDVIAPLADRIRVTRRRFDTFENNLCVLAASIEL